jgi:hypothetical protein
VRAEPEFVLIDFAIRPSPCPLPSDGRGRIVHTLDKIHRLIQAIDFVEILELDYDINNFGGAQMRLQIRARDLRLSLTVVAAFAFVTTLPRKSSKLVIELRTL